MPLITDCYGMQPLDYAFGNFIKRKDENRFVEMHEDLQNHIKKSENLHLVQVIFG